ncbi:MAG: YqgE/AlgH family protein [Deltaproteobacteria bacterium]|nr:YqgE/AlgH family protein [Deltaproteobacteria bacterium]MCB9788308.1 YqgE/AlgH family protein [Deltaproteobacteria bacterium]
MLIAMPTLVDPNFFRSIILLVSHSDEGSFGLIVNHPTDITVASVCAEADIPWTGRHDAVAFSGGPVERERGWVLHHGDHSFEGTQRVIPGLGLSASQDALTAYAHDPDGRFRLLLGYAGWGPGQLDEELRAGAWLLTPPVTELIFDLAPGKAWREALSAVGLDAAQLTDGGTLLN